MFLRFEVGFVEIKMKVVRTILKHLTSTDPVLKSWSKIASTSTDSAIYQIACLQMRDIRILLHNDLTTLIVGARTDREAIHVDRAQREGAEEGLEGLRAARGDQGRLDIDCMG